MRSACATGPEHTNPSAHAQQQPGRGQTILSAHIQQPSRDSETGSDTDVDEVTNDLAAQQPSALPNTRTAIRHGRHKHSDAHVHQILSLNDRNAAGTCTLP